MRWRIIRIFAGFLAAMLLFTVLSRAADNLSIARVSVQRPERGKVTHQVSGSGRVESNREQAVLTLAGQIVKSIYVKEGQQVAAGDLLFEVDPESLREQILEQKQEMKKQELQAGDSASGRKAKEAQEQAAKNRAAEDYNVAAGKGNTAVSRAWEELQNAKERLKTLKKGGSAGTDGDAVQEVLQQACEQKKLEYDQAVQYQKELAQAVDDAVEKALAALKEDGKAWDTAKLADIRRECRTAAEEETPQTMREEPQTGGDPAPDVQTASAAGAESEDSMQGIKEADAVGAAALPETESGAQDAEIEIQPETEGGIQGAEKPADAGAAVQPGTENGAQGDGELIVGEEPAQPATEDPVLLEKRIRLENQPLLDAAQKLADEKAQELAEAEAALEAYLQERASGVQTSADAMQEQIREEIRAKQQAYEDAVTAANDGLRAAGRAVEDASMPQGSDSTGEIDAITREQAELQLAKLEKLEKDGGRVTAPIDGMVLRVNITTGERTPDGTAVLLSDKASGSRLVVQVSKEQEEYIARGDAAAVRAAGGGTKLEDLAVESVRASEETPDILDVTVQLPADFLEDGMYAEFSSVRDSQSYDCRIPLQALYEDNGKVFVYVLQESQSVLGEEVQASRRDVTVLDKNEQYAALAQGALASDAQVIVSSDRMISDGSRVRVTE